MSVVCPNILRAGPLTVLPERMRAAWHGEVIALTSGELRLVIHLLKNVNRVVTKEELDDVVWEYGSRRSGGTVAVLINRIRNKTSKDAITTRRGFGYIIEDDRWRDA
jgi:two-component system OmpR family response regulator